MNKKYLRITFAMLCVVSAVYLPLVLADYAFDSGSKATSRKLYPIAAALGSNKAKARLGYLLSSGEGGAKDVPGAIKWYEKAAINGNRNAQYSLSWIYIYEKESPKNAQEAFKWAKMAADNGDASSQAQMALMYQNGDGVEKNESEAINYARKAAEQGENTAQMLLALYSVTGKEGKDFPQAYKWLLISKEMPTDGSAGGEVNPGDLMLPTIEANLTASQIKEIQDTAHKEAKRILEDKEKAEKSEKSNVARKVMVGSLILGFVMVFVLYLWEHLARLSAVFASPTMSGSRDNRMRVMFIIGLLVVGAFITGIWYLQYLKSPQYSLRMTVKAINQHDLTTFNKYVDLDGLLGRIIDQLLAEKRDSKDVDAFTRLGAGIAKGFVELAKPKLIELAKESISSYVEKGKLEKETQEKNGSAPTVVGDILNKSLGEKKSFQGIKYVKKEGKIAYVGIPVYLEDYDSTLVFDLKMRDKGDYWQIAEVTNFAEIMAQIEKLETERLRKINAPIVSAMNKTLSISGDGKLSKSADNWGLEKYIEIYLSFNNYGEKDISSFALVIKYKKQPVLSVTEQNSSRLAAGEKKVLSWKRRLNMFDKNDMDFFNAPFDTSGISLDIQSIKFADGSELKLVEK